MDMVPDINCKGDASPSVQVPLKVVPERVGASLVEVKLTVAVAVISLAVSPLWVLVLLPSFRVKETVRARLEGSLEVLLKAMARIRAWVAATEA